MLVPPQKKFGNHYAHFCPPPPRKKIVPAPFSVTVFTNYTVFTLTWIISKTKYCSIIFDYHTHIKRERAVTFPNKNICVLFPRRFYINEHLFDEPGSGGFDGVCDRPTVPGVSQGPDWYRHGFDVPVDLPDLVLHQP